MYQRLVSPNRLTEKESAFERNCSPQTVEDLALVDQAVEDLFVVEQALEDLAVVDQAVEDQAVVELAEVDKYLSKEI